MNDAHGESVFDGMRDPGIQKIVAMACEVWSVSNAPLFPTEFRNATLAFALVSKRQSESCLRKKASTRKEVLSMKLSLQRVLAEAKVRYDEDKRTCHAQITILKKLETLEAADARYDAERSRLLHSLQDAFDMLCSSRQPRYLAEAVILNILSYCSRHWFENEASVSTSSTKRKTRRRHPRHSKGTMLAIQPTKLRDPPDKLPTGLLVEWEGFQAKLQVGYASCARDRDVRLTTMVLYVSVQSHCQSLCDVEVQERADVESGVSRDLSGTSRATLDVCIVQAENLPLRDPRTEEAVRSLVCQHCWPFCVVSFR